MSQRLEFRVRWRRQERGQATRIYQSWGSAYRKARAILAMEAVKDRTSFASMAPLAEGPVIEQRPVGDWVPVDFEMAPLSDYEKKSMEGWAGYTNPRPDPSEAVDVPF